MANIVKVTGRIIRGHRFDENVDTENQVFFINLAEISYFEFKEGESEKTVEDTYPSSNATWEEWSPEEIEEAKKPYFVTIPPVPPSGRINLQSGLRIYVRGEDAEKLFNALEEFSR